MLISAADFFGWVVVGVAVDPEALALRPFWFGTAEGTPKLLDFGIAKILSPERSLDTYEATATMMRLLTPEYASPEQLRGTPITTASDVYSLGVVLYELLSGHRPFNFESRSPEEMVRLITLSEPMKPSAVITRVEPLRPTAGNEHPSLTPEAISRTRDGNVRIEG